MEPLPTQQSIGDVNLPHLSVSLTFCVLPLEATTCLGNFVIWREINKTRETIIWGNLCQAGRKFSLACREIYIIFRTGGSGYESTSLTKFTKLKPITKRVFTVVSCVCGDEGEFEARRDVLLGK